MRISTRQFNQHALQPMLDRQSKLAKVQQQVASGKRFEVASEDPAAAVRAKQLEREIATNKQYQANGEAAQNRQIAAEDVLSNVTELLQQVRERVVQGNNTAAMSAEDRRALSQDVSQHMDSLLALANNRNAYGEYVFAGFQSGTQPFALDAQGKVQYRGDQGQRTIGIGPGITVPLNDPGDAVFSQIRAGNGTFVTGADPANTGNGSISVGEATGSWVPASYRIVFAQAAAGGPITYDVKDRTGASVKTGNYASGAMIAFNGAEVAVTGTPQDGDLFTVEPSGFRDVFAIVQDAANALAQPSIGAAAGAQLQTGVRRSLAEIDGALEQVLLHRTRLGQRMSQIDSQTQANEAFQATATETLSNTQDLDYAEAASSLQLQLTALEAAQRSYVSVQSLSLFRLLG